MNDDFDRKSRGALKHRGVIARTPSRLPGIVSFLLTGALFAAALILTFSQAHAGGDDDGLHRGVALPSLACREVQGREQAR